MNGDSGGGARWVIDHWQQVIYHPLTASLTGAFGAAFHAFPGATPRVKALNGVLSFFIGIYGGPAIIDFRNIESERIGAAIIVMCALGGLIAVNAMLDYLRTTRFVDWPIVKTFLGPRTGDQP